LAKFSLLAGVNKIEKSSGMGLARKGVADSWGFAQLNKDGKPTGEPVVSPATIKARAFVFRL
jgi:hypothetical protein